MTLPTPAKSNAPLSVSLFGPMQVLVAGEPLPPVRSRKTYWLLALLALRHGRPVERDWLAGVLWPDADRTQASANLRPALSQLRAVLGSEGERVQSPSRNLLQLDLAGADIDVISFDNAVASGRPHALEQAVARYQGPLLEGCAEEWVFQEREQRAQACLDALLRLAEAAADRADHAGAAAFLRRAAALDPLSDSAHAALMQALAASGDRNAALEIYRTFSERLRRELGGVPQETTTALYTRLRKAAREAARSPEAPAGQSSAVAADAPAPAPAVPGYLPHALSSLVGREEEQTDILACLRRARLVTLTGPGGIGKTRLSVAVAGALVKEYPDGVWFVALDSLPPGEDRGSLPVLQQIASVLGIKEGMGITLAAHVAEHLRRKRLLLVLDNCEHVRVACAAAVAPLLRECAGVRILATSREALRVQGETVWAVPSLPVPDPDHLPGGTATLLRVLPAYEGVQLFLERAQAACKTFALTGDNARDIALLCCRLVGVPLALELAAARTPILTPARIRAQIEARPLDTLSSRQIDVPSRHRTLRATLEWSYGLLPSAAQAFLSDMGVFRDGWTLEAAQAVSPEADALELLTLLCDASLLEAAPGPNGETRFRALETVREFAAEMLEKSGRGDEVRRRHAAYFTDWAGKTTEDREVQEGRAFVLVEKEYPNVRAALLYALSLGEDTLLVRLCHCVTYFWHNTGRNQEIQDWMARVAERLNPEPDSGDDTQESPRDSPRERFLRTQLWLCATTGDFEGAAAASLSIFESYRRRGRAIEGRTNLFNAASHLSSSDLTRMRELLDQCLPLERAVSVDGLGNPVILSRLAMVYRRIGQPEKAAAFLEDSLFIAERDKETDPYGFASAHFVGGLHALAQGNPQQAVPHMESCLLIFASQNSSFMNTNALIGLATAARMTGDREQAAAFLARAVESAGPEPSIRLLATLWREQGEHLLDIGDPAGAARRMRESLTHLRGSARSLRSSLYELGLLLAEAEFAPQIVPPRGLRTARLLGAAQGVAARLGLLAPTCEDLARTARLTRSLTDLLGPDLLARERAEGAALDDEAALAFALLPLPQ